MHCGNVSVHAARANSSLRGSNQRPSQLVIITIGSRQEESGRLLVGPVIGCPLAWSQPPTTCTGPTNKAKKGEIKRCSKQNYQADHLSHLPPKMDEITKE
jgi:hypothetical protein